MTARRFTDKPDLDPAAVWSLPAGHPALVENRTLFPSTVVTVTKDRPERLLVSGKNNRKLGEIVAKGAFKGYALYGLSLEERATCPDDCSVRAVCYGNSMQLARRHRIGDPEVFYDRLGLEILELLGDHEGLLIRLHVLGDFPSVDYVANWADILAENDKVACYGYTHRKTTSWGGDEIGDAVEALKDQYPERFRIRWSSEVSRPDGAIVINSVPRKPRIDEGLVCPAQTDAKACCASCGLCWDTATKHDTIAFIKHGKLAYSAAAETAMADADDEGKDGDERPTIASGTRRIRPIEMPPNQRPNMLGPVVPVFRQVEPTTLLVEAAYQRDLSAKSIRLIRKIVTHWDWKKFKPPICAETTAGLEVIDGQHTSIAAATHPDIRQIPVIIVSAADLAQRADAFISHNRDRVTMTPLQVFHAEVAAGDERANDILRMAMEAGCTLPRATPAKGYAKPGQVIAVTALQRVHRNSPEVCRRVLRIGSLSQHAPVASTLTYALQMICREPRFSAVGALPDEAIARAAASIANFESAAQFHASETGQNRYRAAALLIEQAALAQEAQAA